MIENNRNNEQIYGRNDMIMLDPNNKIYGSLGIADNYVMKTEEGTRLVLSNPKQGRFGDVLTEFDMYGRSEQKSTTGAQLLQITDESYTGNGVTLIRNGNGSYTPSGTPIELYIPVVEFNPIKLTPGEYYVSGDDGVIQLQLIVIKNGETKHLTGLIKIDGTETFIQPFIQCNSTNTVTGEPIPFMINRGNNPLPIEPYTGGIPSPSSDYPQEIKSVGDSRSIELNVMGANVLEGTKLGVKSTVNGITYTTYENGILITGTATKDFFIVLHNDMIHPLTRGTYYLTASGLNSSVALNFYYIGKFVDDKQNLKVTLNKDVEYSLRLQISKGEMVNTTVQMSLTKSKITSYEPYYEEQTVTLPYTLNAIPVQSGGNVTIDGQQWIADYVDMERGKLVRMIGVTDQDTFAVSKWNYTGSIVIYSEISNVDFKNAIVTISSKYSLDWVASDEIHHFTQKVGQSLVIVLPKTITTVEQGEEIRVKGFKFYYILATPIEIDLTTEEITAFKELVTYHPVTIIENNYNTWMKATYKSTESV